MLLFGVKSSILDWWGHGLGAKTISVMLNVCKKIPVKHDT